MANKRQKAISRSIHRALIRDQENEVEARRYNVLTLLFAFLSIWQIRLVRISAELFKSLRNEVWNIDEADYVDSFVCNKEKVGGDGIQPMGDLGYSGSTFFKTADSKFLIKSLPRRSEHSFFQDDFLRPYYDYMKSNPDSFLVRITDFLGTAYSAIGTLCQCTPSHHVIMENVLCDRDDDARRAEQWETYDLKPVDYFYPERDLLPEPLTSEETMSRLFDEFKDKIRITKQQYSEFKRKIEEDTKFLRSVNTVDYSLFLVRYPAYLRPRTPTDRKSEWREGAISTDGKWKYRAVLLDFFWAKHKLQAQAMTGVVQTFNVIGRKGPMSITTTAEEYREKFLQMVDGLVELQG
ncbi:conserved hypothetical protein [Talaromyces stipitatus ATCC 10500]|uniref:PIPK domain-containing protein n=1 Tax=Talaromyces stipitatus (strain ATCC 10500 / CBS 375.48 / QM 6759 / NRRL 1006) TaxID=441959 RepID=B8M5G9_TALSN|nr:uncharacterized protein TSTA_030420 [Talaromyces stipitatus ATCC 10500]EED19775.1 conserved hypothetical protein [Talaromyces stipitatus ATCC 10500]